MMRTMALFDSVSREAYEGEKERRIAAELLLNDQLERYDHLVRQIIDIKRHEHGMNPEGFDPRTLDPAFGLGSRTMAAVDEFASGDPELRRHLVNVAWREWSKNDGLEAGERDNEVAQLILAGETD